MISSSSLETFVSYEGNTASAFIPSVNYSSDRHSVHRVSECTHNPRAVGNLLVQLGAVKGQIFFSKTRLMQYEPVVSI